MQWLRKIRFKVEEGTIASYWRTIKKIIDVAVASVTREYFWAENCSGMSTDEFDRTFMSLIVGQTGDITNSAIFGYEIDLERTATLTDEAIWSQQ